MAALSDFFENKLIDWLFRGQALGITGASAGAGSGPTTLYISLFTTAPTDVGGAVEVTGGSFARVGIATSLANFAGTQSPGSTTVSTGTSGTTSNNVTVTFPAPSASWGIVVGAGVYDALVSGNLLAYGALGANKTINSGDDAPSFAPGSISFQLDN